MGRIVTYIIGWMVLDKSMRACVCVCLRGKFLKGREESGECEEWMVSEEG